MHGFSYRPTELSFLKEFKKKKKVLKIFIILFEQDCPEAVVHGQTQLFWILEAPLAPQGVARF